MKRFVALFAVLTAFFSSCNKQDECSSVIVPDAGQGQLVLNLSSLDAVTKAASLDNETKISSAQVFLFNTDGELYRYYNMNATEMGNKKCDINNLKIGEYSIYVIANGPDMNGSVQSEKQLKETSIELGAYNGSATAAESDFVMGGSKSVTVIADQTVEVTVKISRYVSRITLASIKNNLPASIGKMRVNYCVLSNVVGNQNLNGDEAVSVWYNKDGRSDETPRSRDNFIGIGTHKASAEWVTFANYAQDVDNGVSITTPKYFYAYPNALDNRAIDGYTEPFTPKATALDLSVTFTVSGVEHTDYYNIPIRGTAANPGIMRNYDYNVNLIISGEGEDEPGKFTQKGNITAKIEIAGWENGQSVEADI